MERTKPISLNVLIPWIAVVCLVLAAAWLAELYALERAENRLLQQQKELAELAAQSTRNELEAERIVNRHPRPAPP